MWLVGGCKHLDDAKQGKKGDVLILNISGKDRSWEIKKKYQ
jgi:hypothetical protein